MIHVDINKLIADAMKTKNNELLNVLRLIKSEFTKAEKDGITLDELSESKILLKMVSQREDSIKQYIEGNRQDLVENEQKELDIIKEYLPKQPTEEEIIDCTSATIVAYKASKEEGYKLSMKDMKPILIVVQEKYPSVNGKIISQTLQKFIQTN